VAYTYLLGWSDQNKFYYGVRFAKGCHPNDIWKTYFTSSKHVKSFAEKYGPPDIIQIRKSFSEAKDAIAWEEKLLKRINAAQNPLFLNRANGKAIPLEYSVNYGKRNISEQGRKRISETSKKTRLEYGRTLESRIKQSKTLMGENNHFHGKSHSLETREKMSIAKRDIYMSGSNPNAKKVKIDNEIFETKVMASEKMGVSLYILNKMINEGKAELIR
jgi:hypothetical protein